MTTPSEAASPARMEPMSFVHPDDMEGRPVPGYGALIVATGERPGWIDDDEIIARRLPMGLSQRKARFVIGWTHPYRVRSDHPIYASMVVSDKTTARSYF